MDSNLTVDLNGVDISNGENEILKNVSLKLGTAEFCYLIGKTGTGKSSLLKSIFAELPIRSGSARILDIDLLKLKKSQIPTLRRQMGMVFQDFQLFKEWSVVRNLSYVLRVTGWKNKSQIKNKILEVLKAVSMEHKATQPVYNLSGGEQQRIAIARALLNSPKLIIADEPTGNLDPETSDLIFYLLRDIALEYGSTVLVATHDYRIMDKFPARIMECKNRSLVELH